MLSLVLVEYKNDRMSASNVLSTLRRSSPSVSLDIGTRNLLFIFTFFFLLFPLFKHKVSPVMSSGESRRFSRFITHNTGGGNVSMVTYMVHVKVLLCSGTK